MMKLIYSSLQSKLFLQVTGPTMHAHKIEVTGNYPLIHCMPTIHDEDSIIAYAAKITVFVSMLSSFSSTSKHIFFRHFIYHSFFSLVACCCIILYIMTQQLFVGRLPLGTRSDDLDRIFHRYGRMTRCDVKQGRYLYIMR